jgi:hypothetical protein
MEGVELISQMRARKRKSVEVSAPTGQRSMTFIEYGSSNSVFGGVMG